MDLYILEGRRVSCLFERNIFYLRLCFAQFHTRAKTTGKAIWTNCEIPILGKVLHSVPSTTKLHAVELNHFVGDKCHPIPLQAKT